MVLETELNRKPDSVFLKNTANQSIQIQSVELKLDNLSSGNWEFSLRSSLSPKDLCFGKGLGTCPPVDPDGSVKTGWVVPAGESLVLTDFNLAECLRCPLGGDHRGTSADTVNASLVLRAGNTKDTLALKALFGRSR